MRRNSLRILTLCGLVFSAFTAIKGQETDRPTRRERLQRQSATESPAPERMTWTIAGEEREALVYFPGTKTEGGSPVVFGFHGHGGNMRNADRTFGFQKLWPEAVVVYMQGLPTPGQLTDPEGRRNGWQHDAEQKGGRDLKFVDEVLKTLREKHKIDENRIYASGHSNGGGFTYLLWANRPDVFAAIAPSAAGSRSLRTETPKPVPVMHLAGRNDELVKFAWQELTMQQVRKINGCQSEGKEWAKGCTLYPSETGAPFVSYIHDGTHKYPSEGPALIVKFFKEHKKVTK
jgi:polyhydroxybutyrate depolymerase